jgi:exodeoxyribonuclease VIII
MSTNNRITPAQAGFYRLARYDYDQLDAANHSGLEQLRRSPAHYIYRREHPAAPTEAMRVGAAYHALVLEPEEFAASYIRSPEINRRTKEGKAAALEFEASAGGRTVIDSDDWCRLHAMADALAEHASAAALLDYVDRAELTALWEMGGVWCKGRLDAVAPEIHAVIDLKTCNSASRADFERAIFNFGYHRQAAFYLDACAAIGEHYDSFVIIAQESKAPYSIALYRLLDDIIDLGRRENAELLALYARCRDAGDWPSYPAQIQSIGIPAWAEKRIEEDLL